jgi:hypothetical protein
VRKKIPAKKRRLDQGGAEIRKPERLLQMGDQNVIEIYTKCPEEEEAGNQN